MATEEQPVSVQDRWHELFEGTGYRCGAGALQLLVQVADLQIERHRWSSSATQSQAHQAHLPAFAPSCSSARASACMPVRHQQQQYLTAHHSGACLVPAAQ